MRSGQPENGQKLLFLLCQIRDANVKAESYQANNYQFSINFKIARS